MTIVAYGTYVNSMPMCMGAGDGNFCGRFVIWSQTAKTSHETITKRSPFGFCYKQNIIDSEAATGTKMVKTFNVNVQTLDKVRKCMVSFTDRVEHD